MSIWANSIKRSNTSDIRREGGTYGKFLTLKKKRSMNSWGENESDHELIQSRPWYGWDVLSVFGNVK